MSNLSFVSTALLVLSLAAYAFGWDYVQHVTFAAGVSGFVLDAFVDDWKA